MFTAESLYGSTPQAPSYGIAAPTQGMATPGDGLSGWPSLVHPNNPLFWVGVFLIAGVGLGALAGSARLGPAKVSASVGS
jgi:hypothetical protein